MIELKTREHVQKLNSLPFKFGHEHKNKFNSLSFIKTADIGKIYLADIQTIKKNGKLLYDWQRSTIHAWRNPTQSEIKFGLGVTHRKEFESIDFFQWLKPDGSLKRWIVDAYDGLRYYRSTH